MMPQNVRVQLARVLGYLAMVDAVNYNARSTIREALQIGAIKSICWSDMRALYRTLTLQAKEVVNTLIALLGTDATDDPEDTTPIT